ncbi:hypothetical protein D8674_019111 [Pyrus ussuriensis x Pyrus communis]|uniref:Aminotransferase-like plant mobile domain-containing protein n=1 Tax=Pyrus ussuriensis x Pyrus communis TaxID=2448454 RepID=A0A5N5G6P1_9ROSA|nr:hypothetical protein D8674_019111 [Pyrus ussuriensis x Pyrus communis]
MASNIFITKLSEECLKCKTSSIKTIKWKTLGIYDAIKLSTIEIAMNHELLTATLSFWCSATNIMVLPLGPIGPTVLDISAILGTSPSGLLVDVVFLGYQFDLDLKSLFDEHVRECKEAKREFQERCTKLRLLPNVPKTYNTMGHPIKRADTAATIAAKKKPTPPKKAATVQSPATSPIPMAATTMPASTKELENPLMDQVTKVYPTFSAVIEPIFAPLVEGPATPGLVVTPTVSSITIVIGKAVTLAEKSLPSNLKKKSIIIIEEELPLTNPQLVVEAAGQVNPFAAEANVGHEMVPPVETEATTEMPIHPQDKNLSIFPQKVTSAFVRTFIILLLTFLSQIFECKSLNLVGECLNNLVADGLLSNETVTYMSSILERT